MKHLITFFSSILFILLFLFTGCENSASNNSVDTEIPITRESYIGTWGAHGVKDSVWYKTSITINSDGTAKIGIHSENNSYLYGTGTWVEGELNLTYNVALGFDIEEEHKKLKISLQEYSAVGRLDLFCQSEDKKTMYKKIKTPSLRPANLLNTKWIITRFEDTKIKDEESEDEESEDKKKKGTDYIYSHTKTDSLVSTIIDLNESYCVWYNIDRYSEVTKIRTYYWDVKNDSLIISSSGANEGYSCGAILFVDDTLKFIDSYYSDNDKLDTITYSYLPYLDTIPFIQN